MNLEMRGLRRKMKWQSGKGGSVGYGGIVIKHSPTFSHSRVFGKPFPQFALLRILHNNMVGRYLGLRANNDPYRRFISAICYGSPNSRRHLRQPLRLSNYYYTAITPVFSPRFCFLQVFLLWLGDCDSITSRFLTAFGIFLQLTAVSDPGTT